MISSIFQIAASSTLSLLLQNLSVNYGGFCTQTRIPPRPSFLLVYLKMLAFTVTTKQDVCLMLKRHQHACVNTPLLLKLNDDHVFM